MKSILNLNQLGQKDVGYAGGKGASLGEMIRAGIQVPPGFVITTDVYKEITGGKEIKDFSDEIFEAFDQLGVERVAVRSSAVAEDSPSFSWAGQMDSYLNVKKEDLLKSIQKCWKSIESERAQEYIKNQDVAPSKLMVAVVVQAMIDSEVSGVAFSVHPVTEDRNQIVIEAGFGLGEAVVSGQITPDSYVVGKSRRRIIDKNVRTQTKGLYSANEGGSKWRKIPVKQRGNQVLPDEKILELSRIVIQIENHYGFPCDIEWSYKEGRFYILQSRPITTLSSIKEVPQEYRKYMNRSMFLMDCEIWDLGERLKLPAVSSGLLFFDPLFVYSPGKGITIYYNFTDIKQDPVPVAKYFNEHEKLLDGLRTRFDQDCEKVRELTAEKDSKKIGMLFGGITDIWPLIALSELLGLDEHGKMFGVSVSLFKKYQAMRRESDGVLHWGGEALLEEARELVPGHYKKFAEYLFFDEIKMGKLPSIKELKKRRAGYIYHLGQLYIEETFEEYCRRKNFYIVEDKAEETSDTVKGNVAYAGKVSGRVKIVFGRSDIGKVNEGDVLVTSMTTPNLVIAMNKATAFVTDEGGITCHAAIVAREFKKPCIIGTKVATQVFKDGDTVLVDANAGVVKILKRTKKN